MSAVIAALVPANDWHPRDVDDEGGPDFYEVARTTIVEFVEEGRFNLPRPEDDVAHKLRDHTLDDLDDTERDTFFGRLLPLVMAFHTRDREAFEEEFAKRRSPGFYDPPTDPGQDDLFPS
ncbi:hypothetical protein [Mesorhizobium sp. 8]|uniref:hypothetical protein n=1 Tax=Mesorhizobium sp. 8 TaxID=2584466 RepID=UPI001123CF41|nr:hypothetical protein [Mesorhizobium sp. 8]QDB99525.1 hypothetical protein FGU64_03405 [Mesorhizobium sp. 8]